MPLYSYTAFDSRGKKQQGVLEAAKEKDARDKLREQGLMPAEVSQKGSKRAKLRMSQESLLAFTIQLAQLIAAGLPLYEGLVTIEEQSRKEPYHPILLSLCEEIKRGRPLSSALSQYPDTFGKLYCSLVASGEAIGALDTILDRLAQLLSKQMYLKKEITSALMYPAVLFSFSLIVVGTLLGFVVPSLEGIFADRQLNAFTTFVLQLSHFIREKWWFYIPGLAIAVYVIRNQLQSPKGKRIIERRLLKTPVIKSVLLNGSLARFCRTMSTLLHGGLPMVESLQLSRGVLQNHILEEQFKRAEAKIMEGSTLTAPLSESKWIPPTMVRMIAIGEESGHTEQMFEKLADMYEAELEKTLKRVVSLAQPVILIIMGGMIGLVMIAVLLPLTQMANLS